MKWVIALLFFAILGVHLFLATDAPSAPAKSRWASVEVDQPDESRVERYIQAGDHWLGLSYALAAAFATFCFGRMLFLQRQSVGTSAAGMTLGGLLGIAVCFLTGCCGSPMLPIYMGLLGPQFLSVTKPLTFGVTLISILLGFAWMQKKMKKAMA